MSFLRVHNPIQLKTVLLEKVSKVRVPQWSWFPNSCPGRLFQGPINKHRRILSAVAESRFDHSCWSWRRVSDAETPKEVAQINHKSLKRCWRSKLAAESKCEVRASLSDHATVSPVKILPLLSWCETLELCLNCKTGTVSDWSFLQINWMVRCTH